MNTKNGEFRNKLLATFRVEAEEHVTALASSLVELEKSADPETQSRIIERAFREAHSLKGAARAVNLNDVERVCATLEGKFSSLKRHELKPEPKLFDEMHDVLNRLVALLGKSKTEETPGESSVPAASPQPAPLQAGKFVGLKTEEREGNAPSHGSAAAGEQPPGGGTVRIATAKLDALFLQAEELLAAKLAAQRRAAELRDTASAFALGRRKRAELRLNVQGPEVRGQISASGSASKNPPASWERVLQYLEWEDAQVKTLAGSLAAQARCADQDARFLSVKVDGLVEEMKRVLMLPFSSVLELFPKLVRDLARRQAKEIEFVMEGGEIEVDKRILEEMKEPLIHLLRNAVDHGIEKPQARVAKKKSPQGHVKLSVTPQDAGRIEVAVKDDGGGVELERIHAAAVKLGIAETPVAAERQEEEILALMFRSGVSTNPILTDISGRGLGLAIVQEKVEKLGGTVAVETHSAAGTTFRIVLPVTLATSRGILVRAGGQSFILPARGVERVARAGREAILTVANRETIELDGRAVALVRLEDLLGLPRRPTAGNGAPRLPFLMLNAAGTCLALQVDEILGEHEVLVKYPPKPLSRVRYMDGASVLGSGEVVPLLSIPDLVKSAAAQARNVVEGEVPEAAPARPKAVLVAEDSITARSLLKGILESAGYRVRTATDGGDAWAALKTESFDLVVSDVDMPRLSGFDLTARIRADKNLSKTPVVLVTALESREDRERGIDVGADAYLVKSSFDQSNLLEIVQRLI